jgi:hypothetical protein
MRRKTRVVRAFVEHDELIEETSAEHGCSKAEALEMFLTGKIRSRLIPDPSTDPASSAELQAPEITSYALSFTN